MSQHVEFLKPRLVGKRFEQHSIPLEVLKDLAALEEMIVEVAKWHFRQDNTERKRIPKGFADQISLDVVGIEEGSAIPELVLAVSTTFASLFPSVQQDCFEKARDSIIAAVDAAEKGQPVSGILTDSHLAYFDRIGRSLREDESIELNYLDPSRPARLNQATRRTLTMSAVTLKQFTEEVVLRGSVSEADQGRARFELELFDGQKVRAPMQSQHLETILEAFNGYQTGLRVSIRGVGRFNRTKCLEEFESVEHITILDSMDLAARIDEFRSLKNGWLDGKGVSPKSQHLDWLTDQFEMYFPDDLPIPYLYPTAEGGVQAEWRIEPHELTLEIVFPEKRGYWHGLNTITDDDFEREIDLADIEGWRWIAEQLRTMRGAEINVS